MQRIRLAYVTHGLSANGIENLMVNVARQIDRTQFDVTFIVAIDAEMPPMLYEPEIESLGMRVIRICDLDGLQKKRRYFRELSAVFVRERFDVVHAHMDLLNGIVLTLAKKAGVPKRICHAHNSNTQYVSGNGPLPKRILQKIYRTVMRALIRRAATDRLGCSDAAIAYMYGKAPAVELLNGTDLERFAQARRSDDKAPDLKDAAVHLATVGRISMQKNPLFLCSVIKELSLLRQDFVLHWEGAGDMLDAVKETVRSLEIEPYVQLLGVRSDIPQILCACDYFLLPSLFEGLAIVLIEAQACGLTCFVSDTVSRQSDAGACRFLSLKLDAKAWAEAIDDMIRHAENRPVADPERIAAFDIRTFTHNLEEIYIKKN